MRIVVGVSDMKVSNTVGDILVTHALGSCIGIAIYDINAQVGGILHYMLPLSKVNDEKAKENPYMFGDTGIPELFNSAYKLGAQKEQIRVIMSGGAQVIEKRDFFAIGKRNITIARKMFWKNNVLISAEHVGGNIPRTLYLEIGTGNTWITSHGETVIL
ncbi:MAG: chemotaxis protein CheD [Chitinispirillia bacterium]|jgi:chemotaxis protein CheD